MGWAIHAPRVARYLSFTGLLALASAAHAQTEIDTFVTRVSDGIAAIHASAATDPAQAVAGCSDFLGKVLDFPAMAQAASDAAWERMSATQRDAYATAFAHGVAAECARDLAKYHGQQITLAGVRDTPQGDKLATVRLGPPEDAHMIAWRLRGTDAHAAIDVIFEGHSTVAQAHDQFAAVMQGMHDDIDAVIEALRK